jgi:hypothetical protein
MGIVKYMEQSIKKAMEDPEHVGRMKKTGAPLKFMGVAGYVTGQCFEVDGGLLVQGRSPCAEPQQVVTPDNIDQLWP